MKKITSLIVLFIVLMPLQQINSQSIFSEVGLGIGNIAGEKHTLGKGEVFLTVLKPFKFGEIGLDFTTGGNIIPGTRSIIEENIKTLSPNDTRFNAISLLYRIPIKDYIFIEPRLGYSSLSYFVHTDTDRRINKANFAYGLGIGATVIEKLTVSIRYQYAGDTPEYQGIKNNTTVISNASSVNMILLRMAFRFNLSKVLKNLHI